MPEDNLYPNSGEFFGVPTPKSQVKEISQEKAKAKAAAPVVRDIIKNLDERISFYGSVDAIPDELMTKPDEFMHAVAANKLTRSNLEAERRWLEAMLDGIK